MNKTAKLLASLVLVVAVLAGAGLYWFFRDDAPAEVSLDAATSELTDPSDTSATDQAVADDDPGTTVDDVTGTWVVDTEAGDFDYESATGTFAGFRVEEELSGIGSNTAVDRTGQVTGTVEIDGTTVTSATIEVDMGSITTNDSMRDDEVAEALEPDIHPTATFTLTEPIELGADATNGDPVTATATGELTIHGVTQPATIALEAQLVEGTIVLVGSTPVTFADFEVEIPESPLVLSIDETGVLEFQLLLAQQ